MHHSPCWYFAPPPSPMNRPTTRHRPALKNKPKPPSIKSHSPNGVVTKHKHSSDMKKSSYSSAKNFCSCLGNAHFLKWRAGDICGVVVHHPVPCVFAASLLFFMAVEYTLRMVPPTAPPFDLGFIVTKNLHRLLESRPTLNTILAGLNTAFVGMQTTYILWTWLMEGRPRATISALFMFTCRGILGYVTQLPLPEGFLGSGADFPVGNVSFFLFYSGHVAASIIASLDMKRMKRWELSNTFDILNVLQVIRLLSTRGHYTIDLAVGIGAGILFDSLAGKYEDSKKREASLVTRSTTHGSFYNSQKERNGELVG
ncbi:phosphatidylcholine:diacylglycerol cholinephosphotransferase 1-like [Olea europaea subsp. europaea]|uniref:Phosphatidylcholine:diacylglycerol cholinephosphotransferase 1-like n=1 Tax=Olea europaea subsp. europaea TaxID=158383 RepID=A0A8S0U039_OLEEU|nr:phosphatidylcholine:diacylglycerol cholinephosphotransferase 1-like [Olea europaea subsp. europaea]